ncbi:hypothetical protein BJP34_35090 [Moorena producens PAL-8-15-08-1]|uniref:Uncharacterized protein n=1 Tax=Moorena producens PAL-8-15-08-1 TaxID=1458985 RepID=A0A1D8U234_9CYAN|nr:hypothetical protein [Moorena producens]AOX03961.1 hypothetical protein BJP34_35090 [Moorena producens PAL-8-15-08-1]
MPGKFTELFHQHFCDRIYQTLRRSQSGWENGLYHFTNTKAIASIKHSGDPSRSGENGLYHFTNTKAIASIKPSGVALHPFQPHHTQSPQTHGFLKNLP